MKLSETPIAEVLQPQTLRFVQRNGAAISARLQGMLPEVEAQLQTLQGEPAATIRRRAQQAEAVWERFFWARLGVHLLQDARPLAQAAALAEQDLWACTAILHPI